jgi:hypothetical protein
MKPSAPEYSKDCQEALMDALLTEHARLGSRDDESLLAAIQARTTGRAVIAVDFAAPRRQQLPRPRTSMREWLQIAAIVVLSLSVLGLFLTLRQVERQSGNTHQLISVAPGQEERSLRVIIQDEPDTVARPDTNVVTAEEIRRAVLAEFSVEAEHQSQLAPGLLVYEGGVVLRHPDFVLRADRLELSSSGAQADAPFGAFVASGKSLEIEKRNASSGSLDVARAERATYEAKGGRLILSGGATLSAGKSFVQPYSPAGEIVLRPNGYEVIER